MNLVIDCFKLVKGAGKSIGIYNLAKSIAVHLGEKAAMQGTGTPDGKKVDSIIVLGNVHNRDEFDVPGVTFVEAGGNPRNKLYCILWELVLVRKYARRYQADRVLFPRGYRPIGTKGVIGTHRGGRKIRDTILIHDLIPFYYDKHYPGVFHKLENAYIMYRLKVSMEKADRIITISEYSKEDILDKAPGCGDKIAVIYNGLNDVAYEAWERKGGTTPEKGFREQKPEREAKKKLWGKWLKTGKKDVKAAGYIAAMTSGLPHKNAKGVLKTYEIYRRMTKEPLDLVVFGISDTSVLADMDKDAAAHVRCYKYFEKFEDMCRMAAGAKAYLFLSYVEGFGFPPLEAMQLGVPVVCSDRSSLPEVVADAGLLVSPEDYEGAAEALLRVTTDMGLREELVRKGYENIRRFSWESRTDLYWKELFR
jgi:Glycosyltransferase